MSDELYDRVQILETNSEWKRVLQQNLFGLCKHMDPNTGLIDHMLSTNVLNKKAAESFRVKPTKYNQNQAVLDFISRRPFKDFKEFCRALCATGQRHIVESFFLPGGIDAMVLDKINVSRQECRPWDEDDAVPEPSCFHNFDWRNHIKKNLMCLSEIIDPDHGLIPDLAHKQVLLEWVMDKYSKPEGRCARAQKILLELISKSDKHFELFCESLKATNQAHVVTDYLSSNSLECYQHSLRRSVTCPTVDAAGSQIASNWKSLLVKNCFRLTEEIEPNEDLINHLESSSVMNKQCIEHCKEISPDYKRTEFILTFLHTRPAKDFASFCKALELSDQKHIIETYLQDESLSPAVQESNSAPSTPLNHFRLGDDERLCNRLALQAEVFHDDTRAVANQDSMPPNATGNHDDRVNFSIPCTPGEQTVQSVQNEDPHCAQPVQNTEGHFTGFPSESHSQDSGFYSREHSNAPSAELDPDEVRCTDAIVEDINYPDGPSFIPDVKVQLSSQQFSFLRRSKSYEMNKRVRGRCIIVNNERFVRMRTRTGTAVDGNLLSRLFKQLSFSVVEIKDGSAETIKSRLLNVSKDETLKDDQCLAVFIMSHGDCHNGRCIIYGSDENYLELNEILDMFTPNHCRQLNEKPKLFFIQACRGEHYDRQHTQSDGPHDGETDEVSVPNCYPDFLIGFPTQAGYRAFRDTDHGSWYINALVRVFMAMVHDTSLNSMMNKVAGVASRWLSYTGAAETDNKTQYAIYTCSFTKDFHFFPGIFE